MYVCTYIFFLGICDISHVNNFNQLLEAFGQLRVTENNFPLKAIMCAARDSRDNSPIFVFSDDDDDFTEDQELLGEIEAMVAEKNLEIDIFRDSSQISKRSVDTKQAKSHYKRQITNTDVYQELADFSDGQDIQIPISEISDIGPIITYSATQSSNTIFHHSTISFHSINYSFLVNSYAYQILIFVNGENINNVTVYTPQGRHLIAVCSKF